MNQSQYRYAIYQDFDLLGGGGGWLTVGINAPIPSMIYVQVADGSVFQLKDLPESVAARELEKSSSTIIRRGDSVYDRNHTMLKFTQGKLTYAHVDGDWDGLKIGSDPNGPFYKFPVTREQIIELFGEPLEWKRAPKPPSGP